MPGQDNSRLPNHSQHLGGHPLRHLEVESAADPHLAQYLHLLVLARKSSLLTAVSLQDVPHEDEVQQAFARRVRPCSTRACGRSYLCMLPCSSLQV